MIRILLIGCGGTMGKMVAAAAADDPRFTVEAGVDVAAPEGTAFPVFASVTDCSIPVDVAVDFSSASATDAVLAACVEKRLPLVLATTGLSESQIAAVQKASEVIPIVRSANMSLGINTLSKIAQLITPVLSQAGFDIEIVERHHRRKLDAPSGTAILLADAINSAADGRYSYCYDRSGRRQKRDPDEIGISAVRGGTIVGDHELIFAGDDEVIEISHHAYSRGVFAKGALTAAAFLSGKQSGLFNMRDVIDG